MSETRVRDRIRELFMTFRGQDKAAEKRIAEIAQAIREYGRLIRQEGPQHPGVIVNVLDIAYRFREKAMDVRNALVLLQRSGQASRRPEGDWHLRM